MATLFGKYGTWHKSLNRIWGLSFIKLKKYCHLLISRCNCEKLSLTRERQRTLVCKQTSPAISKSPILHTNCGNSVQYCALLYLLLHPNDIVSFSLQDLLLASFQLKRRKYFV